MKPVMQRTSNDCLRACIASIFEVPWEEAPDTEDHETQHNAVNAWLKDRGLVEWQLDMSGEIPVLRRGVLIHDDGSRTPSDYLWPFPLATHYVGAGDSPRTSDGHAVVMKLGKIVHDPHPAGDMTIDRITSIHVYVARLWTVS